MTLEETGYQFKYYSFCALWL